MNYRIICTKFSNQQIEVFSPYAIKKSRDGNCIIVQFNDEQADEVKKLLDFALTDTYYVVGEDGFIYSMSNDSFAKTKRKHNFNLNREFNLIVKDFDRITKRQDKINDMVQSEGETSICKFGLPFFSFKGYKYINKEHQFAFSFRFKNSKSNEKQPLVIFLHGAGALGFDNFKQMIDFALPFIGLKDKNCSILVPQQPFKVMNKYLDSLVCLIEKLIRENQNIDSERIYLVGTSLGGFNVWNMIYRYPNKFACAVSVMGALDANFKFDKDVNIIKDIPIWVAHSSDDDNVSIKSDDYYVGELQKLGADVTYTRWNKYGHRMCNRFYLKEPWSVWMFSK